MDGSWIAVRLVCAVVVAACGFVQGLAMRRLTGEYKARAQSVQSKVLVSGLFVTPVLVVSGHRGFNAMVISIFCVIALVSTGFIVNMLRSQKMTLNRGIS